MAPAAGIPTDLACKGPVATLAALNRRQALQRFGLLWGLIGAAFAGGGGELTTGRRAAAAGGGWVTVVPAEYPGAINNPLKGFRAYKPGGYGLLERKYIPWNVIEAGAGDSVDRIIAHTNRITQAGGRSFEDLNVKLVPRVYLDWNGRPGTVAAPRQHWPVDLATFDYDSPAFQERLKALIAKLGQAWDQDPRIFAVQMGLIGFWGEHHNPAPTAAQRRLLTEAFRAAFKHKPVLVRHTDPEFMAAGFGIYYDTFAHLGREPPTRAEDQFPWMATHRYREIWKVAPIEGEVEYHWQQQRPESDPDNTFGRTPDETMRVPAYRRHLIGKIRRYHASYLGWISNYNAADAAGLEGAAEIQRAFGYRFVIDSLSYPLSVRAGEPLEISLRVRNTGSAPFYLDWPVAVALLDPKTRKPLWWAPLEGVDIRRWLPGEDWDEAAHAYRRPAPSQPAAGRAALPGNLAPGEYFLALAILDRQGGMVPSARFAATNYFRGGWHPFGMIGVGQAPRDARLQGVTFDDPAFDPSLSYRVPAELRAVAPPPAPVVQTLRPWSPDPVKELIDPWRYWNLETRAKALEKRVSADGPVVNAAGRRVVGVAGDFGPGGSLRYSFFPEPRLAPGRYRFACRVRGSAELAVAFEVADGGRALIERTPIPLVPDWREHVVEFAIPDAVREDTSLRFVLPREITGEFALTDTRLRKLE